MKPRSTFVLAWLLTGFMAVAGSIVGNAAGKRGLVVGALIGGCAGVLLAVLLAVRLGWLERSQRGGAMAGGLVGFAIAALIAGFNLHTPVIPVASAAIVGAAVLFGAGYRNNR